MSILMRANKQVATFVKLVSGEFAFAATYLEKEKKKKMSFYRNK